MAAWSLPENCKLVWLNFTAANAVACDILSCKNAHKVWLIVAHNGSNDTDLTLQLAEYVDVAATGGASSVTLPCPIWACATAGTANDTFVRATDDDNIVIDPATQTSYFGVLEWDPSKHTAGYDCIGFTDSGGHASNQCFIMAIIEERYHQVTPPSAIID